MQFIPAYQFHKCKPCSQVHIHFLHKHAIQLFKCAHPTIKAYLVYTCRPSSDGSTHAVHTCIPFSQMQTLFTSSHPFPTQTRRSTVQMCTSHYTTKPLLNVFEPFEKFLEKTSTFRTPYSLKTYFQLAHLTLQRKWYLVQLNHRQVFASQQNHNQKYIFPGRYQKSTYGMTQNNWVNLKSQALTNNMTTSFHWWKYVWKL